MSDLNRTTEHLGFLTVIEHPKFGLVGGYLVLNRSGRPREFHCTSPVKPNRAQEVLYGETLQSYLCEQIAATLLAHVKTPTSFVMTDNASVLTAQSFEEQPIGFVFPRLKKKDRLDLFDYAERRTDATSEKESLEITEELNESLKSFGIENSRFQCPTDGSNDEPIQMPFVPGLETANWVISKIGNRTIALPQSNPRAYRELLEEMKAVSKSIDLAEPFTRIRLAIEEAQRAA